MSTTTNRGTTDESTCTPGSVAHQRWAGGHPSRPAVAGRLQRPTRRHRAGHPRSPAQATARERSPSWPCSGWGLPSHPGHPGCWWALTPPFHPYLAFPPGGLLSVALSRGLRRVAVSNHPALWSPDFPRRCGCTAAAALPTRPHRQAYPSRQVRCVVDQADGGVAVGVELDDGEGG